MLFCADSDCGDGFVLKPRGMSHQCVTATKCVTGGNESQCVSCSEAECCNDEAKEVSTAWFWAFWALLAISVISLLLVVIHFYKRMQAQSHVVRTFSGELSADAGPEAGLAKEPPAKADSVQESGAACYKSKSPPSPTSERLMVSKMSLAADYTGTFQHPSLGPSPFKFTLLIDTADESTGILVLFLAAQTLTLSTSIPRDYDTVVLNGEGCHFNGILFTDGSIYGEVIILNEEGGGTFKLHKAPPCGPNQSVFHQESLASVRQPLQQLPSIVDDESSNLLT